MAASPQERPAPSLPVGWSSRPIAASDFESGALTLLSQLTHVGVVDRATFEQQIASMAACGIVTLVVCDTSGTVRGMASLLVEPKLIHGCGKVGHIEDVVVDAACRGQRLGEWLIAELCRVAARSGCYKTILDCDDKNAGFYEKCGFKRKGVEMRFDH